MGVFGSLAYKVGVGVWAIHKALEDHRVEVLAGKAGVLVKDRVRAFVAYREVSSDKLVAMDRKVSVDMWVEFGVFRTNFRKRVWGLDMRGTEGELRTLAAHRQA